MRVPRRKSVTTVAAEPAPPAARRNVEIKARLLGEVVQTDTYYSCRRGRLKLRELGIEIPQLVWYDRPDQTGPKPSDYRLVPVADAVGLKTDVTIQHPTR